MNRKTLIAGAAGAFALAATVAIAQTYQTPSDQPATAQPGATSADSYSADSAVNAPSADTAATDTAAMAGERG